MHSSFPFVTDAERGRVMGTKEAKKLVIRNQIITASQVYQKDLAGKTFLYVSGDEYFEVVFQADCFLHLTGVSSVFGAKEFYEKAKASTLTVEQFQFDSKHPYYNAKKKLSCLSLLPALTNSLVCIVKNMQTVTLTYKIGVTNLDFTLGLTENIDFAGNKINSWFLPRTLRVKDKSIERSNDGNFVDFIFSKDASMARYGTATFSDPDKTLPLAIKELLVPELFRSMSEKT